MIWNGIKNATELWKDYLKEWPDIPKVLYQLMTLKIKMLKK